MSLTMKDTQKETHLQSYKMKLTTLSPIFIGGGEDCVLNKTQYIFDEKSKKIHILNEKEWANFLTKTKLFDAYLDFSMRFAISNSQRYQGGLSDWLREKNHNYNSYAKCIKYTVDANNVERGHDLRCFTKNVDMKPYIPGSSIKGAIRTAILVSMISKNKASLSAKYWPGLKKALENTNKRDSGRETSRITSDIEKELLYNVFYENTKPEKLGIINDMFKGILISDSTAIDPKNLTVLKKQDLSTYGGKLNQHVKGLPIFREYLKPKTECSFTISIDTNIVKSDFCKDLQAIENCLLFHTHNLLEPENGIYENFSKVYSDFIFPDEHSHKETDPFPNLCIGGGAGFYTKVFTYALAPELSEASNALKKYFDTTFSRQNVPIHKHVKLDGVLSPRTLKLAEIDREKHIVGWCEIIEVKK